MMLYFSTAIAGYWTFGDLTFTPILCNLPRGDDFAGRFVQVRKRTRCSKGSPLGAGTREKPAAQNAQEEPARRCAAQNALLEGLAAWRRNPHEGALLRTICDALSPLPLTLASLVQITKLFVAFHVMTAYPILMNALVTEIECKVPVFRPFLPRMLERCTMVGLTLVVALFLPFFGELMTLVGAGALTVIVFVLPVVFNFKLRSDRKLPIGVVEYVCGVFVVLMGLAGGSIGGVQAVKDLVAAFKSQ